MTNWMTCMEGMRSRLDRQVSNLYLVSVLRVEGPPRCMFEDPTGINLVLRHPHHLQQPQLCFQPRLAFTRDSWHLAPIIGGVVICICSSAILQQKLDERKCRTNR